ncbi:DUF808 domain-containing protein [Thauera sp. CAU 1555]|uniref:DUF808 domain-containing protein n=1 Tax=Thauera sedimentorum TaxID=2767595 RepID=A0ABR9B972_9RHOO|nr:DUF808 domain-containing protein [Thauera sedimentorum]MBC9071999.1 DUF808 domain-containing protein [Thauera sedimentorum]MBD8502918.1 DUF808 domain-containing protein [Thauera sedimentorum]
MAGTSLFVLLDDIASVLDDVATMTKVATKKTAGVLGDDLALNAQQVAGVRTERELPVVWAVAKGSMLNKLILVPAALAIAAFLPWAIVPLLMLGGAYLCYEGVEKLVHHFLHRAEDKAHRQQVLQAMASPETDLAALEREKIRGAVRTDFILSAEIIVIALGVIGGLDLVTQLSVLAAVAVMMTVGVYGLVAIIVKLDDLGLLLRRQPGAGVLPAVQRGLGGGILWAAPWLMRGLSVAGTVAMFLVGGGILSHGLPPVHHAIEAATADMVGVAGALLPSALDGLVGIAAGIVVLLVVSIATRLLRPRTEVA